MTRDPNFKGDDEIEKKTKKWKFVNYYKYSFCYESEDGKILWIGGNADDIYRSDFKAEMTLEEIEKEGEIRIVEKLNISPII